MGNTRRWQRGAQEAVLTKPRRCAALYSSQRTAHAEKRKVFQMLFDLLAEIANRFSEVS